MTATPADGTRRYDSPVRREQAAATRDRIVEAGAALVHEQASWRWEGVTVRAVATRAGVHERTVHRHFATERDLRAAVLQRLVDESGVTVEGMRLEELPEHVNQLFGYLSSFTTSRREPDGVLVALDERRKAALLETVAESAAGLSESERRLAAAMVDVLWGLPSYDRLITGWQLDASDAARGVTWVLQLVSDAVRQGRGPGSADSDR